jgi:formate C-acetyltransferase
MKGWIMNLITLKDIRLKEYNLENIDLLKHLRKEHFKIRTEICIERARYITLYLRDMALPEDSMEIKYAKAVNYFLSNKEPIFFDDNLLGGTTTSKPIGAPVYPEFTGMTIWPELDTISNRSKNPQLLSRKDADKLNFNIFPFWIERNILEYTRNKYNYPRSMKLFEQFVFFIASKAGTISHTVPNYKIAIEKGLEYIIENAALKEKKIKKKDKISDKNKYQIEFFQAVQIAMQGIINYAQNLSKKAAKLADSEKDFFRKQNLLKISGICNRVPAKPATTFREAINTLWIVHIAIHAENINMAMSPGRLDQILYRYYKNDIDHGILSIKDTLELMGCLFFKFNDNTNLVPETAEELFGGAGPVPAVTIGGIDTEGNDAVNDLTYIILRTTEMLRTRDPSLNARYHYEKNTEHYRNRVAEVIANTKAVPAFHNDVINIKILENQKTKTEHARDYAIIGCVELSAAGRSYDASSSIMLNLISALELTLYNGKRPITGDDQIGQKSGCPTQFDNFEEFWEAFKIQLKWLIGEAIELNEYFGKVHQEIMPTPLLSTFFEGPLQNGKDLVFGGALYNSSGATHIGFADTVDSMNAIEKAIFLDKICSFAELIEALKVNFKGYEKLRQYLVNKTPKYGTEDPIAIKNAQNLIVFLYDYYQKHTNYRGGKYRPGYWTMTNHAGQGRLSGALPNGRKEYQVFASGITPVSQATKDLAECLKVVGKLNKLYIPSGMALNLKYPIVEGKKDIEKFAQTVESYFRYGGSHVQFNIMSYEMLLDAKENPQKYPELLVRVSGYSAYFNTLNEAMKDEIITRTAFNLKSGKAIPFPIKKK